MTIPVQQYGALNMSQYNPFELHRRAASEELSNALKQKQVDLAGQKVLPTASGYMQYNMLNNQAAPILGPNNQALEPLQMRQLNQAQERLKYLQGNAFQRLQNTPGYQQWISQNPQAAAQLLQFYEKNTAHFGQPQAPVAQPMTGGAQPMNTANAGTALSQKMAPNSQAVQDVQDAIRSSLIKKTVPSNIQNQRYFTASSENMLNDLAGKFPMVSQYAGPAGFAKYQQQRIQESLSPGSVTDPAFKTAYALEQNMPVLANEFRRALGGQASDAENRMIANVFNFRRFMSSPELAEASLKQLQNLLSKNRKAVVATQAQTEKQLKQSNGKSEPEGRIAVRNAQGVVGTIPASQLNQALANGYVRVN